MKWGKNLVIIGIFLLFVSTYVFATSPYAISKESIVFSDTTNFVKNFFSHITGYATASGTCGGNSMSNPVSIELDAQYTCTLENSLSGEYYYYKTSADLSSGKLTIETDSSVRGAVWDSTLTYCTKTGSGECNFNMRCNSCGAVFRTMGGASSRTIKTPPPKGSGILSY